MSKVVIIGAGHAGGSVAGFLKQYGFEGQIVLAGAERVAPYQRPPLSKAWLKGEADEGSLQLRADDYYAENGIDLRLGVTATAIDKAARTVSFDDGTVESYDHLVIATGSRARKLPIAGGEDEGLLELRTTVDAERLKASLGEGKTLVVVGGGYVGLEAAASARALGGSAIVLERMERVLQRVASPTLSAFYMRRHTEEGVEIRTDVDVTAISARSVTLADGTVVQADAVLVGIGAIANDDLARDAGLECNDGILVDLDARTSEANIYAVGDVTRRPMPHYDNLMFRLESVPNALEQAKQAASAITGRPQPVHEVPWFWSDQYDAKLQIAGLPFGSDGQVVRGDPDTGSFAVFHMKGDRIVCVEAVNAPQSFMFGKQAIGKALSVNTEVLADEAAPIKSAAAA
ncbi:MULTISPECIES: NAD(P)/FAD-dependent oxidoreductase [unclassified Brevundimonas]|uniref:NAD(P)/FAD-dependent oxidoreductase n=1 Tax=unclassified Brevundimonas TaxID=2622653 RepID=UPI0025BD494A|nr:MULTISPECIES: FAD-dependent oxidoreductase [unclassified Brevundimonas]